MTEADGTVGLWGTVLTERCHLREAVDFVPVLVEAVTALTSPGLTIAPPVGVNDSAVGVVGAQVVVDGMSAHLAPLVVVVAERTLTSVAVADEVRVTGVRPIGAPLIVFEVLTGPKGNRC